MRGLELVLLEDDHVRGLRVRDRAEGLGVLVHERAEAGDVPAHARERARGGGEGGTRRGSWGMISGSSSFFALAFFAGGGAGCRLRRRPIPWAGDRAWGASSFDAFGQGEADSRNARSRRETRVGAAGDDGGSRVVRLARERRARPNAIRNTRQDVAIFASFVNRTRRRPSRRRRAPPPRAQSSRRFARASPPSALDVVRRRLARGAALARPRARAALPARSRSATRSAPVVIVILIPITAAAAPSTSARWPPAATTWTTPGADRTRARARLPITLITVSRGGGPATDRACEEWSAKIARYVAFDEKVVRPNPKNAKDPIAQMRAEGERVMKHVQPDDFVVALDERGKDLTSEGFAALLADAGDAGKRSVVFALGGPFGHDDAVRRRADVQLRLGAMVMNHQVARIVALEQMYRAWTILRGEPYHH